MGKEILLATPVPNCNESEIEQESIFQEKQDEYKGTQTSDYPVSHLHGDKEEVSSEGENVVNEKGTDLDDLKEINVTENDFQEFKDNDCSIIPSPMLKTESVTSYFGSDLASAIQILGLKYNKVLNRYQEQNNVTEMLKADFEHLSDKCSKECEPKYEELKKKYTRERCERKRLYNEIIELRGNIRVFCRCRPLSSEEISKGFASVVEFDPSNDSEFQVVLADNSKKQFRFDHVFSPNDSQEAVFEETLPVVKSVLDGYNVCIFAYGQTGTGKTFTMEGTPENRGVNYRALEELFKESMERNSSHRYEFSVSMLEVYNEKIRDLLSENSSDQASKKLEVKQIDGTQDVPGLLDTKVCDIDEVWEILQTGGKNRSVGSTNANELSSRSHCLVRVTVKVENLVDGERNKSHMWLVDLAGSERVGKTEVEGERLKESQFINKSLSALGDVIAALASKNPHIPYRNSKLTHLLQSSLGGDCKTLMFTQISPSSADLGETICSLNFATRVRGIESGPAKKQSDPAESFKVKQLAEKLRQEERETARLSESLQLMQLKYASRENVFKTLQEKIRDAEQTSKNYQMKVRELENQLAEERKASKLDSTSKNFRPPLAPIQEKRKPLSRITTNSRIPPGAPARRSTIATAYHPLGSSKSSSNKENNMYGASTSKKEKITATISKARRISLSPVVRSIPFQPKRRASLAILPSESEHRSTGTASIIRNGAASQLSKLGMAPRRSLSAVNFPSAPKTPDGRSRIPTGFATSPSTNKLCFSVQKRISIGLPAPATMSTKFNSSQNSGQNSSASTKFGELAALLGNRPGIGRLGTAQRFLTTKKRRQSVI